jgi:hypothetical protein
MYHRPELTFTQLLSHTLASPTSNVPAVLKRQPSPTEIELSSPAVFERAESTTPKPTAKPKKKPVCVSPGAIAGGTVGGFFLGVILAGAGAWFWGNSRGFKRGVAHGEKIAYANDAPSSLPSRAITNAGHQYSPVQGEEGSNSGLADGGMMERGSNASGSMRQVNIPNMAELGEGTPVPVGVKDPREIVGDGQVTGVHPL